MKNKEEKTRGEWKREEKERKIKREIKKIKRKRVQSVRKGLRMSEREKYRKGFESLRRWMHPV